MNKLLVKRIHPDAIIPTKDLVDNAGYDLYSVVDIQMQPGCPILIPIGIQIEIPEGCYGRIAGRSSLAAKHNLMVNGGVIDRNYRGEIQVIMVNLGHYYYEISKGDKIAQLIIERCEYPLIEEVDDLSITSRGDKGFGSSGYRKDASRL